MTATTKEHPVGTGNVEVVRGKGKYRANEHPVDMNIPERKVEKIRKFFEVENVGKEKSTESEKVVNNTFETNCKVIREHPVDCDKPAPVLKRGGGVKVPVKVAGIAQYLTTKNKIKGTEKKTTVASEDILKSSQGQTKDLIIVKEGVESKLD